MWTTHKNAPKMLPNHSSVHKSLGHSYTNKNNYNMTHHLKKKMKDLYTNWNNLNIEIFAQVGFVMPSSIIYAQRTCRLAISNVNEQECTTEQNTEQKY